MTMRDSITVYGIANCDTVKKARAWLAEHGVAYTFHDYKRAGVDPALLSAWAERLGWEQLLNRAGTTWRKLPEAERAAVDSGGAAAAVALMAAHPSCIRRPVVEWDGGLLVGFRVEEWARALTPSQ